MPCTCLLERRSSPRRVRDWETLQPPSADEISALRAPSAPPRQVNKNRGSIRLLWIYRVLQLQHAQPLRHALHTIHRSSTPGFLSPVRSVGKHPHSPRCSRFFPISRIALHVI
jgi:hypothetical protein